MSDSPLPGSFNLPTPIPHSPNITPPSIKRLQPTSHLCQLHSHYLNTHLSECLQRRCHRDLRDKIRPDNRFRIAYFSSGHHPVEKKVILASIIKRRIDGLDAGTGPNLSHQNLPSEAPLYTKNNRQICALFIAQVQQSVCFFIGRIYVHLQSVKTYPYPWWFPGGKDVTTRKSNI